MSGTDIIGLEDRDVRVLEMVNEYGRPMISTLREVIYWADKNQHIHYRVNKLDDGGYVETWKDDNADTRGPLSPVRVRVTSEGGELLDEMERRDEMNESVEEQLETIQKRQNAMRDIYGEVKERIIQLEERVEAVEEGHGEELEEITSDVENLKRFVGGDEDDGLGDGLVFGDD